MFRQPPPFQPFLISAVFLSASDFLFAFFFLFSDHKEPDQSACYENDSEDRSDKKRCIVDILNPLLKKQITDGSFRFPACSVRGFAFLAKNKYAAIPSRRPSQNNAPAAYPICVRSPFLSTANGISAGVSADRRNNPITPRNPFFTVLGFNLFPSFCCKINRLLSFFVFFK